MAFGLPGALAGAEQHAVCSSLTCMALELILSVAMRTKQQQLRQPA